MNHILELMERKLWAGERIIIPIGSARLVKVRTEGGWKGRVCGIHTPIRTRGRQEAGTFKKCV